MDESQLCQFLTFIGWCDGCGTLSRLCLLVPVYSGFSLDLLDMGICRGGEGTSAEGKVLMGGTHEGGLKRYGGGPNFDRLYHKLKVLLLLLYVVNPTLVIQLLL